MIRVDIIEKINEIIFSERDINSNAIRIIICVIFN